MCVHVFVRVHVYMHIKNVKVLEAGGGEMVEASNTSLATPLITYLRASSLNRVLTLSSIVCYLLSTTCLATTITLKTESSFKAVCGAILRAVSTLFVHKLH